MYCIEKNCNEIIHSYNKVTHLYCYTHGQLEKKRICPSCKEWKTYKQMNTNCYSCVKKEYQSPLILHFIRNTSLPWLPFLQQQKKPQHPMKKDSISISYRK